MDFQVKGGSKSDEDQLFWFNISFNADKNQKSKIKNQKSKNAKRG